jgi:hypothetical protein
MRIARGTSSPAICYVVYILSKTLAIHFICQFGQNASTKLICNLLNLLFIYKVILMLTSRVTE